MDRRSENGREIQNEYDGRSKIMIQLKLVNGDQDNNILATEDPGGLHGRRVIKQLVRHWAHSRRLVCAESYLVSVP